MNKVNLSIELMVGAITISGNLILGLLIDKMFFENTISYLTMICCGISLFTILIVNLLASKSNYKLDLLAVDIEDKYYLILNSIFIFSLVSVPLSLFISLF